MKPPPREALTVTSCLLAAVVCLSPALRTATAAEYRVHTAADLKSRTLALQPGDTLIAEPGTYTLATWDIQNISGTRTNWIAIRGESNVVIQGTSTSANVIQFGNAHYVALSNFEIVSTAPAAAGIDGVNFKGSECSHIVLDRLKIHGMGNNGVTIMIAASFITLRNSTIFSNAVCGIYWGYPASHVVHDVLVENNYIHHCPADPANATGYGIQFKGGCYRGRFVDNVLHDVGGTSRSGLIVYYGRTNPQGDVPEDRNIVRGNVLWNCRNEGITAMSDALVENNLVFDAVTGINLQTYSDELGGPNYVENLIVRNNTAFRCGSSCINVSGWSAAGSNVAFTGNAAYRTNSSQTALSGSPGTGRSAHNVCYGTAGFSTGVVAGSGLSDFRNVASAAVVPNLDFYPSANSALAEKVATAQDWPERDFNGTDRPQGTAADAGAYEYVSTNNPGGAIQAAPKPPIPPAAPVILRFEQTDSTNYSLRWSHTVQWTQVEFAQDPEAPNWQSLAGPLYATNATVTPPADAAIGFFRLRLE